MGGLRGLILVLLLLSLSTAAHAADGNAIPRVAAAAPGAAARTAPGFDLPRVGFALIGVIALILLLRWAGERFFGNSAGARTSRAVNVLCRNTLGPKQNLLLVQVGRRLVLIGNSGAQMTALGEITDADEIAEVVGQLRRDKTESVGKTFGAWFKSVEPRFEETAANDSQNSLENEIEPAGPRPENSTDEETETGTGSAGSDIAALVRQVRTMSQAYGKTRGVKV